MNKLVLVGIVFVTLLLGATFLMLGDGVGANDTMLQLGIAGAVAIAVISTFVSIKYIRQMQTDTASGELADENWDGIGEYKNEPPFGWAISFLALTIWAIWYMLAGYPVQSYSQIGEYNEEVAEHDKTFAATHANMDAATKVEMGESVFIVQCAPCHGLSADGIDGKAANLNKRLDAVAVKNAIIHGSNNHLLGSEMPMPDRNGLFNANSGALISDAEINAVSAYVSNGMSGSGADVFAGTCAGCHGSDGKGMAGVAPSIANYNPELVSNILAYGKKGAMGTMPSFNNLNKTQIEALGAYVTSLSSK